MSLGSALQIGRSSLIAHQTAIEVAGNNLANLATPGYHRQSILLSPVTPSEIQWGIFIGQGVEIADITRHIDAALEGRIRSNLADQSFSQARRAVLSQIEAVHNELTDADLSTHLNILFNAFSELANSPQDNSLRTLAMREASNLSVFVQSVRNDLGKLGTQVDRALDSSVTAADDLLTQIEQVNDQVVQAGGARSSTAGLRDTRDALLAQLSQYIDISVNEQESGSIDIFVASTPIMLNGQSRGIDLLRKSIDGEPQISLVLKDDGSKLAPTSGQIGAQILAHDGDVSLAVDGLDEFINQVIFEINKVHSQGQGLAGFSSVTGTNRVLDQSLALNDPESGLNFTPVHGSFQLHVTQLSTGERRSSTISVGLDGLDPAQDARLSTIADAINAVVNVDAAITLDGRLSINGSTNDVAFSFSDDTSGLLAALGINTFFAGSSAQDIAVNPVVNQNPAMVAASHEHLPGDNRNALDLAALRDLPLASLGNLSITEAWARRVEDFAVRLGQTEQQIEAESIVGENLAAQQQAVSGVNADEEVINLLLHQRAYQGSARFLQVVDELLETLIALT